MSSKQIASDEYSYYIENLLFNHDIELLSQFVKDMSFEKKEAFAYFTEEDFKGKTDFSLNIEIENKQRDENQIMVSLVVNLEAKINQKTAFLLEMTYCGLFRFPNVTDDLLEKQIKVECPKMLFPYIRRLISQIMIESGMPNIDIKNINFFDLYKSKQKN
ncbi:protein-export chaperone SecB [Paracoccaceae bacterium]|nr:protein-export chaperone SecB [Paracoccaceae bacterium]